MMKFDPIPDDRVDVSLLLRKNFPCPPNGNVLPECGLEHVAALLRDAKHSVNGSKTVGFCILVTPDHGDTMRFIYPLAWKPALDALQGILDGDSRQEAEWHTRYAESEEYKLSYVATQVMDEPLLKLMTTYFNDGNYFALFVYSLVLASPRNTWVKSIIAILLPFEISTAHQITADAHVHSVFLRSMPEYSAIEDEEDDEF